MYLLFCFIRQITRITSNAITATPAPADAAITASDFFSSDSVPLIAESK
jgi:hypothetical protein